MVYNGLQWYKDYNRILPGMPTINDEKKAAKSSQSWDEKTLYCGNYLKKTQNRRSN